MSEDIKWQAMAYVPKDGRRVLLLCGDSVEIKRFANEAWFNENFSDGDIEGTYHYLGWAPVPRIS